jgi:hypothetical protein
VAKILLVAALQLLVAGAAHARKGRSHYMSHGNAKWAKRTLTVGQARKAIALAVAKKLSAPRTGMRINPQDINVTVKLGADGKTALWRAEAKPRRGSPWRKMMDKGIKVDASFQGTVDVALRQPTQSQIKVRAQQLFQERRTATAKSDWHQAKQRLTRFGNRPRERTVRKQAHKLYQGRTAATAKSDYYKAERELTLDLGNRVTFINSSKQFHALSQKLMSQP